MAPAWVLTQYLLILKSELSDFCFEAVFLPVLEGGVCDGLLSALPFSLEYPCAF